MCGIAAFLVFPYCLAYSDYDSYVAEVIGTSSNSEVLKLPDTLSSFDSSKRKVVDSSIS